MTTTRQYRTRKLAEPDRFGGSWTVAVDGVDHGSFCSVAEAHAWIGEQRILEAEAGGEPALAPTFHVGGGIAPTRRSARAPRAGGSPC